MGPGRRAGVKGRGQVGTGRAEWPRGAPPCYKWNRDSATSTGYGMMIPVVNQFSQIEAGAGPVTELERPRRADAVRNRERVLEAAEQLFATEGLDVHIEQVAQRAGVGVGTVCRNFPTKDSLIDAVLTVMWEDRKSTR